MTGLFTLDEYIIEMKYSVLHLCLDRTTDWSSPTMAGGPPTPRTGPLMASTCATNSLFL